MMMMYDDDDDELLYDELYGELYDGVELYDGIV
jgi:hypothetical protein